MISHPIRNHVCHPRIYHTTIQASTMQLVFGRYSILNIKHVADWEHIRQRKQLRINHEINAEICTRITTNTRLVKKF